ncbi:MAG: hypothetical protein M3O28_14635 [Actinomycetota bacterium]|nr:hypothetical protein [Actinomycetota bacterium]
MTNPVGDLARIPGIPVAVWENTVQRRALGASVRALLDVIVRTGADPDELAEAAETIDRLTARLSASTFARTLDVTIDSCRAQLSLVGGLSHPVAPQLQMTPTETGCEGVIAIGPAFEGGPGLVHGGVLGLLFDHAMAYAAASAGRTTSGQPWSAQPVMTGKLNITYRRPTPINAQLTVTAAVDRVDGRKLHVSASISAGGQATTDANALFIALTQENIDTVFRAVG